MSYAPRVAGDKLSHEDAPRESTGPIASDSLAAESIESSAGFAENEDAVPLGVRGASSTLNTTDTSGATALRSAESGAAREKQDALGRGSDEKGVSGLKYPDSEAQSSASGAQNSQGNSSTIQAAGASDFGANAFTNSSTNEPSSEIRSSATATTSSDPSFVPSSGTAGVRPYVDPAPNYAGHVSGAFSNKDHLKPKGSNLTEGGIPETKTFTGDVGGPNDPGRLAERKFEVINEAKKGDTGPRQDAMGSKGEEGSSGQYDVLESERA